VPQSFKSVYFTDFPGAGHRTFKIAFGERDAPTFRAIESLSSFELRRILGTDSFAALRSSAAVADIPVSSYCVRSLRRWLDASRADSSQLALPHFEGARLHSTFRAGRLAPLHRWYPFLEGYSPKFVQEVITRFASNAATILDPFAGVGTTPLEAARLGRRAFYCELNPLLQFLVETKVKALVLPSRSRLRIVDALGNLAGRVSTLLKTAPPDATLKAQYLATFGTSKFFEEDDFLDVLRARTLLDRIGCENPTLGEFATVAALASLIPSSNLRRAGDLRYRRGSEFDDRIPFLTAFGNALRVVAEDLSSATPLQSAPVLIAGDARRVDALPPLGVDAIITSPPYLNGTNYFRNTKVELWFLRSVRTAGDLTTFRSLAVTAGINDVVRHKQLSQHPGVQEIVATLEKRAYDRRIPQMVGNYYFDLELCLRALSRHVKPGALLAMDIGDSMYAGVHVPTDRLLVGVAERAGFALEQSIHLRTRLSRDMSPLKQVLLVMRFDPPGKSLSRLVAAGELQWAAAWRKFKHALPHQQGPYSKRNWGHGLHSLCSYQGKMKPSLAHQLVSTFLPPGSTMLDPFAGVGTIPFEAALQGSRAFAFEISPAALAITGAKLGRAKRGAVEAYVGRLEDFLTSTRPARADVESSRAISFNGPLPDYFHQKTLREILVARQFFRINPPSSPSERLVLASLLHILHGNRPYALSRRSHPITPFAPTGPKQYRPLLARLHEKLTRSLEATLPASFTDGFVLDCDATTWWPHEIDRLDAIITSPPFFDSTRFHLANWLRLWFVGWDRADFESRPLAFVDERQKASFHVYEPIFRQARERLKRNGVMVLHLGRSRKCDMAAAIAEVAAPWFTIADRFSESVQHCESHGIRDKGTVTVHDFVVLH
jgi:tRNA G10  N-methylase Trm11